MKALLAGLLLVASASLVLTQSKASAFKGEIMDSQCASMGTHERMMKGLNSPNAKDCTQKCIGLGGKYVLFDPGTKTTYQIDDQQKVAAYAGQQVSVKASFDAGSKTIHVESVEPH
jgi:hypothetical protein